MYLLAEDEGNEEEILRLLESTPPPSHDVVTCELRQEIYPVAGSSSSGQVKGQLTSLRKVSSSLTSGDCGKFCWNCLGL